MMVTWALVAAAPTCGGEAGSCCVCRADAASQPGPQNCLVRLGIPVNRFIIWGNNCIRFPDRFKRVTGLVNPVGQEPCYTA